MQGSLRLHGGVLFVGRQDLTAEVATYDLGGRPLETRFSFKDEIAGRSSVSGMDVDADRRLWIADGAASCLRCFTLFGVEVASVRDDMDAGIAAGPRPLGATDRHGMIGSPVDLRVLGEDDDTTLIVASAGRRRHGLQILHIGTGRGRSIPPLGDPEGAYERIRGMDWRGSELVVVESGVRRVQLFEGDPLGRLVFRHAFPIPEGLGDPEAVALVGDGRVVIATAGTISGLHIFDASGRYLRRLAGDSVIDALADERGEPVVEQPSALALDLASSDRDSRLAVLDRDGERVQIFSLDGRSFGSVLSSHS
ncbi:hypothetical protein Poly30_32670 [Planctomycetes bacterium Poly30]|uniref:NHL repeat protein n=1 Tax=Saltatorellus ferox TaxID=2528018 RepID=A0A518EUG7_9BACT|nr:hypothetical protein Poly30_32670 [Planctomycetes bacterium Poly30]